MSSPVGFVADPVIAGVSYVLQQGGVVRVVRDGQLLPAPFIDLSGAIGCCGERGLLGMAFPPDAATSGRVFFNFTDTNGDTVVARFRRVATNPLVAVPATRFDLRWSTGERVIRQPFSNHNGGHLAFGPDGYLYIGLGDGGGGNDPQNNAQSPGALLGKMLRIDVNVSDGDPNGFRIPPDNPFLDGIPIAAQPEIWSFGWRNPWRYSFDDFGVGATGALIIGDVGQGAREELNYEPIGAGGRNYGWRMREGKIATPGIQPTTPAYLPLTDPIHDYPRTEGQAITGGYVYRGTALPMAYRGRYFFADYVRSRVWSLGLAVSPVTGEATPTNLIEHTGELGGAAALGGIASFARDLQGELYLATFGGRILRIAPSIAAPNPPRSFQAVVTGHDVLLSWNPPAAGAVPTQYLLEAGTAPGLRDLASVFLGSNQTSVFVPGVPSGTYYARVRSAGGGGVSAPSNEIVVVVTGGCTGAPPAPFGFVATVSGPTVNLAWSLGETANGPTDFVIEAGSSQAAANVAIIAVAGSLRGLTVQAPAGTYYVRIRSRNGCGASGASSEIVVTVH
ncbi:MAG: PQQ-dependent sugar dehydrogenase [Vicinamibacterales bacterium]